MGTESYIYGYAATVEDPRNPDSLTCDYQYSVLLTTILMYNLGLTHHWRSDAQGDSSLPIKALTLYQMAYSLLQRSSSLFHKNEPFILGILNNMGAIYHTIGEYDKAHNCFQALKHLCIINRGVLNVGYEAHSGIMLNIIFLSHAPHTAAAA
jgi:tetratricopeptide (TPR) repeat protein